MVSHRTVMSARLLALAALAGASAASAQPVVVNSNAVVKSSKRGLAVFAPGNDVYSLSTRDFRALDPGLSWYYNWGILKFEKPADVAIDYVPMVWGAGSAAQDHLAAFLASGETPPFVLALNEPNLAWEANMTPQHAATTAVQIKAICDARGVPLVAPQVTIGTDPAASVTAYDPIQQTTVIYTYQEPYLSAFNYYCGANIPWAQATHSYGGLGETSWITGVMNSARPAQPVFVTELNWSAAPTIESAVANVMATVDHLERASWIGGYAWFMARITGDRKDSILATDGELTEVGAAYVNMPVHDPDIYYRLPGRLQAEKYVATWGEDISPTTDAAGFADMVCGINGAYLDYNVQIPAAATYQVAIRVAGAGTISIHRGSAFLGSATATSSGWSTVTTTVNLSATGLQTLRVSPASGQRINHIDWITAAPATPAGLSATSGDWKIKLSWSPAANAASYLVKRSATPGSGYVSVGATEVESFIDATAQNGTTYHYVVAAVNHLGQSADSASASAKATANPALDSGFESPDTAGYLAAPSGGAWTFAGSSGLAANGSAYTWANPAAPEGDQVAYLQSDGAISQTLDNLAPGSAYQVTFKAAQRQSWGGAQTWDLRVDGVTVASFAPPQSSAAYATYSAQFVAKRTGHTLAFVGTTVSDNTVFIDDVQLTPLSNFGFESPVAAGYAANPTGAAWTFLGSSGVSANASGYTSGNPASPKGKQVAYLQGSGSITQTLGGFQVGKLYTLRFSAAQRANWGGAQSWNVLVNGNVVASFAPPRSATLYEDYVAQFTATAATQTIAFVGTGSPATDNTVFIDDIRLTTSP